MVRRRLLPSPSPQERPHDTEILVTTLPMTRQFPRNGHIQLRQNCSKTPSV